MNNYIEKTETDKTLEVVGSGASYTCILTVILQFLYQFCLGQINNHIFKYSDKIQFYSFSMYFVMRLPFMINNFFDMFSLEKIAPKGTYLIT